MSVNKCPTILDCQCIPNPFRNLSAENPDPPDFFSFEFFDAQVPLGAPDTWWGTTVGQDGCTSTDSQQTADDCALRLAEQDVWNTWPDNGRAGTAIPIFGNQQQQCQIACADGGSFTYTVPAGTVIARTQQEADGIAISLCLSRVRQNRPSTCKPPFTVVPLAWWKMEESGSGNRADAIGAVTLVPGGLNGTISQITGKVNKGMQISATRPPGVTMDKFVDTGPNAPPPSISNGFDMTFWMKIDVFSNAQLLVDFFTNAVGFLELKYDTTTTVPNISLMFTPSNAVNYTLLKPFNPVDGQWHFYRMFVDAAAIVFGLQIDNGAITQQSYLSIPFTGTKGEVSIFLANSVAFSDASAQLNFDELNYWPRKLTSDEVTALYNSGAGHTYPFT